LVLFVYLCHKVTQSARGLSGEGMSRRVNAWGPVICVYVGCLLCMVDAARHVIRDHGGIFFDQDALSMYDENGQLTSLGLKCQQMGTVGAMLLCCGLAWYMIVLRRHRERLSALGQPNQELELGRASQ